MGDRELGNIVVAGDWVVDEYWFTAPHQSDLSSHVGFSHYRSAADRQDKTVDLCGAGHVARVLFHLARKAEVIGVGCWNERDTERLQHLLHSTPRKKRCSAGQDPYILGEDRCAKRVPELLTLDPNATTTRAVRQYNREELGWTQLSRLDFEIRHSNPDSIPRRLRKLENVTTIIVHDLDKGAVSAKLIKALKKFASARWYIRAKSPEPRWLDDDIKARLELFIVGPEVVSHLDPFERWIVDDYPSEQAVKFVNSLHDDLAAETVALLTAKREIVARINQHIVWGTSHAPKSEPEQVGWGSSVMAALTHGLLTADGHLAESPAQMKDLLGRALALADDPSWQLPIPPDMRTKRTRQQTVYKPKHLSGFEARIDDTGIVDRHGRPELELWRAFPQLPTYVTCIEKKRQAVEQIATQIRSFTRSDPRKSLSIAIQADPGSGKSSLVKALANAFDLEVVTGNISMLTQRIELLDLFDEVATKQAESDKGVLVFVDEINARLENDTVYASFLAPLEDLIYRRSTRLIGLKPSIWLFAGTRTSNQSVDKLSDFHSRLNAKYELDFESLSLQYGADSERLLKEARQEQIYLGAIAIQNVQPSVVKIEDRVLDLFGSLPPESQPARTIIRAADTLRNVRNEQVVLDNLNPEIFNGTYAAMWQAANRSRPERFAFVVRQRPARKRWTF